MAKIAIDFLSPKKEGLCPIAIAYDKQCNVLTICILNCMIGIQFKTKYHETI